MEGHKISPLALNFLDLEPNKISDPERISDPILVCYVSCDWKSLMNNFALYGYDEKLVMTVHGLLEFQTVVNEEPSLNKRSMSLGKLDTQENLRERVLRSKMSRDEFNTGSHKASFDTDILRKLFKQFMKSFEKDTKGLMD